MRRSPKLAASGMALAAAAALLVRAAAVRTGADSGSHSQVEASPSHSAGLEAEHEFTYMTHNARDAEAWRVWPEDEDTLKRIISELNPANKDVEIKWEDRHDSWTFGLVQKTSLSAKEALAQHVLHRHGFGPLLAAYNQGAFEKEFAKHTKPSTMSDIEFFVGVQGMFSKVKQMQGLLESLSLSSLRNLHSYDHQLSVDEWSFRVPTCSPEDPTGCILQAGKSTVAKNFIEKYGFNGASADQAKSTNDALMMHLHDKINAMGWDGQWMTHPEAQGLEWVSDYTREVKVWNGGFAVFGRVRFEGGLMVKDVRVDITEQEHKRLSSIEDADHKAAALQVILDQHVERVMAGTKAFMGEHNLKVWAGEEAELYDMMRQHCLSTSQQESSC